MMSSTLFLVLGFLATFSTAESLVKVGDFTNKAHGIGGQVFAKDEKTLVIKDFTYDGAGPDAFFWVGKSGKPSRVGTILPHPFKGKFYEYEDESAPILTGRFNQEEITLTLPDDLKATELKWLSVWCRKFAVNFGDVYFPDEFALGEEDKEEEEVEGVPEGVPPPLVEPVVPDVPNTIAHDPNRHDDTWEDPDAALSKAEPEGEPEGGSHDHDHEPSSAPTMRWAMATLVFMLTAYLF